MLNERVYDEDGLRAAAHTAICSPTVMSIMSAGDPTQTLRARAGGAGECWL